MIEVIILIIQIILILVIILYIYLTFRHSIEIPTAESLIKDLSPGLAELTKIQTNIVFWFYSLTEKKYLKYILDNKLNITVLKNESAHSRVSNPSDGYFFNFSRQRWEKKIFLDKRPYINSLRNTVEQKYKICYTTHVDGGGDEIVCTDEVKRTFIKMDIGNETYSWDPKEQKLFLPKKTSFPTTTNVCKFTSNRYKEYLGMYVNINDTNGNTEESIGVYFTKDENSKWILNKCPSFDSMYFNGTKCVDRITRAIIDTPTQISKEIFYKKVSSSDLSHKDTETLSSYYLQLNTIYSTYININAENKIYNLDVDFYNSCRNTIYIVGSIKKSNFRNSNNGDDYNWKLKQILNNSSRKLLLKLKQYFCPILEEPTKLLYIKTGEISDIGQRYIIYKDRIFYAFKYLDKLLEKISFTRNYIVDTIENKEIYNISNNKILPHVRKYKIENKHGTECLIYALFMGECIFDIYGETRLLIDYIDEIHQYDYFDRHTYPILEDDFHINIWSCAQDVDKPERFTYISLVDIYNRLALLTKENRKLPNI